MITKHRIICTAVIAILSLHTAAEAASVTSDFEDLNNAPNTYWNGSDLSGGFDSGCSHFNNAYNQAWGSWNGFAYSSVNDTNTAGYGNQFAVWTPGTGISGTGTYAVVFDSAWDEQDIVTFPFPSTVKSFYINNTTYAALSMLNGDANAKKFGGASGNDPDWFKLTISGKDGSGRTTGAVDFYLADYRFTDNAMDYIIGEWTKINLASLGSNVRSLHFSLSSSDVGGWGMNTPAYFAMDNLEISPTPAVLTADFEDNTVDTNLYWNGSDLSGGFQSEWVNFNNSYNTNYNSWGGFAYSSVNDTNTAGYGNQFAVWTPGTGVGNTGIYAVVSDSAWNEHDIVTFREEVSPRSLYINNTTYAALDMLNGSTFSKKFGGSTGNDPDWFKLTISGKTADGTTAGSIDFYLADYRFTNNSMDYIVGEWTKVDLTPLGPGIKTLHFSLSSSDVGGWGMNTPAYFAMDNLEFIYSFSDYMNDKNMYDSPIPGFVGPGDNGSTNSPNYINPAFTGWGAAVTDYSPVPGVATEWTNSANALGPATGSNFDIASLGELDQAQIDAGTPVGTITLQMSAPITDGKGADFAVFENGFFNGSSFFAELGYVEVSSDGTNFARFRSVSLTTNSVGPYEGLDTRNIYNLCGKHANAYGNSWGTPFDLSDLAADSNVINGTICLTNINYVRIVDIPGTGDFSDSLTPPNPIRDPWQTFGSGGVDLEAIGIINSPDYSRISVTTEGPGSIAPYGIPDVAVHHGSNITFNIAADSGHHLLDVIVNGRSIGATNNCTFTNVQNDQTVKAVFGNTLTVSSPYGTGTPSVGIFSGYGDTIASMSADDIYGTTQYVCVGWTGTGSVPSNGTSATAAFSLTNDSAISWNWATNFLLNIETVSEGSVDIADGWFAAGSNVTATADPAPYYQFSGWSGDTAGDTNAASMTVTMTAPLNLTAHFYADETTNSVPLAWLAAYGLTNRSPETEALDDSDFDGADAWQEFYAGTDPNDPDSVFAIIDSGVSNGVNYVTWTGGTNGSARPFTLLGTESLTGTWFVIDGSITRSASGTNRWTASGSSNLFYRISVDTD